ncbi:hypothetical protein JAAARDRAFT_199133 [Jaapia argillacea MUCL 33604]|uniref:Uncharacterized protein n=1 Tax=Jaapia argillacea MUCL 33604 TaxID=933084 RepID=A0A067P9S0_9AGAM|nr:hypothetical protein JAAARDRAFT_199133 [Jaapia argillacea MUCL 33604]
MSRRTSALITHRHKLPDYDSHHPPRHHQTSLLSPSLRLPPPPCLDYRNFLGLLLFYSLFVTRKYEQLGFDGDLLRMLYGTCARGSKWAD